MRIFALAILFLFIKVILLSYVTKSDYNIPNRYKEIKIPQVDRWVDFPIIFNYTIMIFPFSTIFEWDSLEICNRKFFFK
jgi:hypothetical protein